MGEMLIGHRGLQEGSSPKIEKVRVREEKQYLTYQQNYVSFLLGMKEGAGHMCV